MVASPLGRHGDVQPTGLASRNDNHLHVDQARRVGITQAVGGDRADGALCNWSLLARVRCIICGDFGFGGEAAWLAFLCLFSSKDPTCLLIAAAANPSLAGTNTRPTTAFTSRRTSRSASLRVRPAMTSLMLQTRQGRARSSRLRAGLWRGNLTPAHNARPLGQETASGVPLTRCDL